MTLRDIKANWEWRCSNRRNRLWNLPFLPVIRYPLRAMKISVDINPTGCWWRPSFTKRDLTERAKAEGETIWWARWLWFQISYSRFL